MVKVILLAISIVILCFVIDASPRPTPSPAAVSPTPTQGQGTDTKEQLRSRVEAALTAVNDSQVSRIPARQAELKLLQVRVEAFKTRLALPDSRPEALRVEAEQIIQECNILKNEKGPTFWSTLLGANSADYLGRAIAVVVPVMLAVVIILVVSVQKEGKHLRLTMEGIQQQLDEFKPSPPTSSDSEAPVTEPGDLHSADQQALEIVLQAVQTLREEWLASLEKLLQASLPEEPRQNGIEISPQEIKEDVRKVAQNAYVKDVIRATAKDCQVTARYSVGHSCFLPDTSGELVVVLIDSGSKSGIILPKTGWLSSPDQFYMHYQEAYTCEQPNMGSMFILSPAVVEKETPGWKLTEQGSLELRG